jgi:hypothetical protein
MIGRRKKAFFALYDLLRAIEASPDNLVLVRKMNLLLVKEVLRAEDNTLRHKAALKALNAKLKTARGSKDEANNIRRTIRRTESYINGYHQQRYIWKCFGDGLAYAYIDKYAIKHAFYATDSYDVKPSAGMLGGKSGLVNELSCLFSAIEHDVPAVLCDVTNILRYGDICLLGGSDPCLIEVKSSPNLNQRGKRQAATLKKLTDFLETDRAEDFRTLGVTKRFAMTVPERNYQDAMNACIAVAERDGHCIVHPEPGLTYFATYGLLPKEAFATLENGGRQIMFMLNEDKISRTWTIYEPFTRSIRGRQHLLDFVVGRLVLMVVFDVDALCEAMQRPGWDISFHEDVPAAIQFHHRETGAYIGVSRQFLGRIGFEFVSLSWIAENQGGMIEELSADMFASTDGMMMPNDDYDAFRIKMFGRDA